MQWIVFAVILVASAALQFALRPRVKEDDAGPSQIEAPDSVEGQPLPVVFGRVLLRSPVVVWFGHKKIDKEGSSKKGYRYEYHIGAHFALCHQADAIRRIFMDAKELWAGERTTDGTIRVDKGGLWGGDDRDGGFIGDIGVLFGRAGSSENSYLANRFASPRPYFRGAVSTVFQQVNIGMQPTLRPTEWEIQYLPDEWYAAKAAIGSDGDANPAHILYAVLTNVEWGMGYPAEALDLATFTAAADTLYSEGFGLSLEWAEDGEIWEFVQEILDHANGVLYESAAGLISLALVRDDYDLEDLPVFDEATVIDLVSYGRRAWGETINEVVVTYQDRANLYRDSTVSAHDYANMQMQGGIVTQKTTYRGVKSAGLASRLAARDLKALSAPVAKVSLQVTRAAWALRVGSVFRFQWAALQVDTAIRVLDIDYGTPDDQAIRIDGIEDVFSLPVTPFVGDQPPPEPDDEEPVPVSIQWLVDMPFWEFRQRRADVEALSEDVSMLLYAAARPGDQVYEYELYTGTGGSYTDANVDAGFAPYAVLAEAIGRLDTDLSLGDARDLSRVTVGALAAVGDEWVVVDGVDLEAETITVQRGALDTIVQEWPADTEVWFYDEYGASDEVIRSADDAVNAKAVTRALAGELDLGDATAITATLAGRARRPYNVKKLQIAGEYFPSRRLEEDEDLVLSWSNTDRLTQVAAPPVFLSDGVPLEAGVEVRIEIFRGETLLRAVTTTDSEYTYTTSMERDDLYGSGWNEEDPPRLGRSLSVRFVTARDAVESWQVWEWSMVRALPALTTTNEIMSGASFASGTVGDDEVVVSMEDAWEPAALMIVPVNADVLVEYSFDDGATYEPADEGVAGVIDSVHTLLLAGGLTHVRLTRASGAGTASQWAIC